MRTLRFLFLVMVVFNMPQLLLAQEHYIAWCRGTFSSPIAAGLKGDFELQHRRQNGLGNHFPFDRKLTYSARVWFHYRLREHVQVSVSPIACFYSYKLIQSIADEAVPASVEYRTSAATELRYPIVKRLRLIARPAVEYRMLEHAGNIVRGRARGQLRYDVHSKISIGAYDEVLLNIAGAGRDRILDQNRVALDVEYKFTHCLKLNAGYMMLQRYSLPRAPLIHENSVVIFIMYQLDTKKR